MTEAQLKYLEFLRFGLWPGDSQGCNAPLPSPQASDELFGEVLKIARQQQTVALVCCSSDHIKCQTEVFKSILSHGKINSAISEISAVLDSEGIPFVLLKGQGCAAAYHSPELRACGDIDIYVGQENSVRARDILLKAGGNSVEAVECDHHYGFLFKGVTVELHFTCMCLEDKADNAAFAELAAEGLSRNLSSVNISGCKVSVPANDFNAFYIFYHFFHHFLNGGVGFRQLCDWSMVLHSKAGSIDLCNLRRMVERMRVMHSWQTFGYIAVKYLGLPQAEMPFYDPECGKKAETALGFLFEMGNFGALSRAESSVEKTKTFFGRKIVAFFSYTHYFFRIRALFPENVPFSVLTGMLSTGFKNLFNSSKTDQL